MALVADGHLVNDYQADGTFVAAETFARGRGNCLGYTNLFIALARDLGLNARYQLIESHPTFDVTSGYYLPTQVVDCF